jgi:conjugative transfer signal peptidase TraF
VRIGTVVGSAALLVLGGHLLRLRIMLTDSSAPAGIYRLVTAPAARGALVAACLPAVIARVGRARGYLSGGACPANAEPVAKVIGAVPGDVVKVAPEAVTVNDVRLLNSRTAARDSAGRPLEHVAWGVHAVGGGQVWLFGFHDARSWDARYFGPVAASSVQGELRPVVTW